MCPTCWPVASACRRERGARGARGNRSARAETATSVYLRSLALCVSSPHSSLALPDITRCVCFSTCSSRKTFYSSRWARGWARWRLVRARRTWRRRSSAARFRTRRSLPSLRARVCLGWSLLSRSPRRERFGFVFRGSLFETQATFTIGVALRENGAELRERAPEFFRRLFVAISTQLSREVRRDGARLQRDLSTRLRTAARDVLHTASLFWQQSDSGTKEKQRRLRERERERESFEEYEKVCAASGFMLSLSLSLSLFPGRAGDRGARARSALDAAASSRAPRRGARPPEETRAACDVQHAHAKSPASGHILGDQRHVPHARARSSSALSGPSLPVSHSQVTRGRRAVAPLAPAARAPLTEAQRQRRRKLIPSRRDAARAALAKKACPLCRRPRTNASRRAAAGERATWNNSRERESRTRHFLPCA